MIEKGLLLAGVAIALLLAISTTGQATKALFEQISFTPSHCTAHQVDTCRGR